MTIPVDLCGSLEDNQEGPRHHNRIQAMNSKEALERVFERMDKWRHLPSYRLEPRVDVFFSFFIKEALEAHTRIPLRETIIPEFPIRKGTLQGEDTKGANQSTKVDFVLFSQDLTTVFLVELKTDKGSRRSKQDDYLEGARQVGFHALVEGIVKVASTPSQYTSKYVYLLTELADLGFVRLPDKLNDFAFPKNQRGLGQQLGLIEALTDAPEPQVQVIYIQPERETDDTIGFDQLADILSAREDELATLFVSYLRRWQEAPAKSPPTPSKNQT